MLHTPTDNVLVKNLDENITATGNSQSVDVQGYEHALIIIHGNTAAASTLDAKVQDSADNSTFADVTNAAIVQVAASQTRKVATINLKLSKRNRYLRIVSTIAGTVSAGVTVILFNGRYLPPTQDVTPVTV